MTQKRNSDITPYVLWGSVAAVAFGMSVICGAVGIGRALSSGTDISNSLCAVVFGGIGLLFLAAAYIAFTRESKFSPRCCHKSVIGTVCGYTLADHGGIHPPIIEYVVDGASYRQRLRYTSIKTMASSSHKVETELVTDKLSENLTLYRNLGLYTNPMRNIFPVGTRLKVYYDGRNPKHSYVARYARSLVWEVIFWSGISIGSIGLIFAIVEILSSFSV